MGATAGKSFDQITARLDEIVVAVRSKETSLERSLDLFDEAIKLGAEAVDLVDSFEFSERETALLDGEEAAGDAAEVGADAADGTGAGADAARADAVQAEVAGGTAAGVASDEPGAAG